MNLLIAMLSQTYEEVVEESQLRWRLLLAQTTLEYYENVHSIWELAPLNVFVRRRPSCRSSSIRVRYTGRCCLAAVCATGASGMDPEERPALVQKGGML